MELITIKEAPAAIGPYSHAVRLGDLLYLSGQVPFHPETGEIVGKTMAEQTRQALANADTILKGVGLTRNNIVKTTVFLTNYDFFAEFNAAYGDFMGEHRPARTAVEVSRLPKNALVEIEVLASFK